MCNAFTHGYLFVADDSEPSVQSFTTGTRFPLFHKAEAKGLVQTISLSAQVVAEEIMRAWVTLSGTILDTATIATNTGLSEREIVQALQDLFEANYIQPAVEVTYE